MRNQDLKPKQISLGMFNDKNNQFKNPNNKETYSVCY